MYGPSQKLKVKVKFKNIMKVIHASTIIIARFNWHSKIIKVILNVICVTITKTFIIVLKHLIEFVVVLATSDLLLELVITLCIWGTIMCFLFCWSIYSFFIINKGHIRASLLEVAASHYLVVLVKIPLPCYQRAYFFDRSSVCCCYNNNGNFKIFLF
jgi:hypothetical protein